MNKKTIIKPLRGEQTPCDNKLAAQGIETMNMLLNKLKALRDATGKTRK
jgi:hypothetical protein